MKCYCRILFFLLVNTNLFAQASSVSYYKNSNKDVNSALEIKDSIAGPYSVSAGIGSYQEIMNVVGFNEEGSSWFKIVVSVDTLLTFDIVPEQPADDFDFVIFKCATTDCVKKIRTRAFKPHRFCFSINFDKSGSTGLSEYASGTYIGGGPGAGYASALPVKKGEILYLLVNFHPQPNSGKFSIYFYNYWPDKPQVLKGKFKKENEPVVLENVLFKTNESTLLKESFKTLDKLVDQLQKNNQIKIKIEGHTDNTGNETDNQKLSEKRAQKIVSYLISKGIDSNRLLSVGFGSKQPIASNETEEGRAKNRRVAFVVLPLGAPTIKR
jgi:outer membrane protein OmpA-like peptidoglycan-associated protein